MRYCGGSNLTISSQKTMNRHSQNTSVQPRTAVGSWRGFVLLSMQPMMLAAALWRHYL